MVTLRATRDQTHHKPTHVGCDRKVGWKDKGVACDNCNMWFHCSCVSMSTSQYTQLDNSAEWKCYRCNITNSDNSMYHSYNIPVANSFSILAGSLVNDNDLESLSPNFCPAAHSSPQTADKTSSFLSRHSSVDQSACSLPSKDRNIRFISKIATGRGPRKRS